jgi:cytochrome o ubiquinol oxidase subunit 2
MDDMMRIDAKGGLGLAGVNNVLPLEYDKFAGRGSTTTSPPTYFVASTCNAANHDGTSPRSVPVQETPISTTIVGSGLPSPGLLSRGLRAKATIRPAG